eukprot:TRINITY_DN11145_c0_g1_i1.p1 TRINITY_DN11145_c0_g1~~TRINITY_DN11145_c0_g1_i1.p1  ORF type:complete len:190 (+),score=46.94 TRINITY_DN11145_c0_g1_i1:42-611(+)
MSRRIERIKKPFKILNRDRSAKKGIVVESLEDLFVKGRSRFGYPENQKMQLLLEEDGTEIEDDEYLFSLPDNTLMVLIYDGDRWSGVNGADEVDSKPQSVLTKLEDILVKLEQNPSRIALLSEPDLELLVDLDIHASYQGFHRFSSDFLKEVQRAAENHMIEKGQLRDTIGLLELYHQTNQANVKRKKQ